MISGQLIYSGVDKRYADIAVRPYSDYEYMLTAYNSEGQTSSPWQRVRTKEGPPEGVPAPVVKVCTPSVNHDLLLLFICHSVSLPASVFVLSCVLARAEIFRILCFTVSPSKLLITTGPHMMMC